MAKYGLPGSVYDEEKLRFSAFQHPYVCTFVEELQKGGVTGLLTLANQRWIRDRADYKDRSQYRLRARPWDLSSSTATRLQTL